MPSLEYFLLAESASVDRGTGLVSIFNVLNEFVVEEETPPFVLPKLVAISGWLSTPDEISRRTESHIKLEFKLPGQDDRVTFRGNLQSVTRHQHFNFGFREIPLPSTGDLVAYLYLDDNQVATHTVTVRKRVDDDAAHLSE